MNSGVERLKVRRRSSKLDDSSIVQAWAIGRNSRSNEYRFVTWWRVRASALEIWELVSNPEDLVRWFPATFLDAKFSQPAAELRPGSQMRFQTKGWLPYTMRFDGEVEDLEYLRKCSVNVRGDFEGRLVCEFRERKEFCTVRFQWDIRVHKPLVRRLSFPLKMLFCSNHLWVMFRGWQSLKLELANRQAGRLGTTRFRTAPPGPTFPYGPRYGWLRRTFGHFAGRSELKLFR
jgi:hypothetical protein